MTGLINTQLINRFELAQVVARRITNPQGIFFGSNLTGYSISIQFFFFTFIFMGGSAIIILFMSYFFIFIYLLFYFSFFIPLACIRHIYKTSVTVQTTVNSEIYAK